ncbi:unnamed protein product [Rhizoctonia solani]|uniref:Uncharacterized protein n=1 Tax=Rhizoctonia solani TaxID=456999 RepID=A0A8H3GUE2_9AGAM|nr:unnamed protein product [Rhizoctonia solani]
MHAVTTVTSSLISQGSAWLNHDDDDNDPEGIRALLCISPTLDKNVKENTLPFVLHCYSQWAIASIFEPRKIVHALRDQVIAQISSESSRVRTILIANVMNMCTTTFATGGATKSILNHLTLDVRNSASTFINTPPAFAPALDRQNAVRTLDSMLEILGLQTHTQPTIDGIQSLEYAAPIFRRACIEPQGQPINLPNILLDPSLNLRYFATMDIILSITNGRSTRFQYEVPFSLELCEQVYRWQLLGNYGSQWLYGLPDQFIMLLAWINTLSETPGAGDNSELIAWIEEQLPQIRIAIDEAGEPLLRIGRMVVQECWRFAVFIYLYMALCNANAHDPRVTRAQKGYMRLVRGVKPGRNPDLFLIASMSMAGVATTQTQDRDTLRQRILNIRECAKRGTCGNDVLLKLEDIWERTANEGRPAVWSDLRVADLRIRGK